MEQKRKYSLGLILSVVLLVGLLTAFVIFQNSRNKKTQATDINPDDEFDTMDARRFHNVVREVLPNVDELTQLILVAQAMHETGNFTSPVFYRNNNAFGMRLAQKRPTTAIGDPDKDNYANYDSIEDSVEDLKLWFDYHGIELKFDNIEDYSRTIKEKGYYEASFITYTKAMNAHFKTLQT
jgi:uncharacterized FlgJ-related protein